MLGRLMKYEFKSTYREFLGIYCALIISTLLTWMVDLPQLEVVGYIASICVFAVIVAAIVIMLMSILGAFNKRVYGREGYLNMTLPATVHQQVLARLFVSVIWCLITIIVMVLSFLLLLQIHGGIFTQEILLPQVMDLLKAWWENNVIFDHHPSHRMRSGIHLWYGLVPLQCFSSGPSPLLPQVEGLGGYRYLVCFRHC